MLTSSSFVYGEDCTGFYNRPVYEATGQKWRPVDIFNGRIIFDNGQAARIRAEARNRQNTPTPGYWVPVKRGGTRQYKKGA